MDGDAAPTLEGPVFLNEAQSRNDGTIFNTRDSSSDWLELYNASDEEITLEGYALEDKGVGKRELPAGTVIAARGFLLVIADDSTDGGSAVEPHFPFKLDGDEGGDELLLTDPDGTTISRLVLPALDDGKSFGRSVDGGDAETLAVLPNPSPRVTNTCVRPFDVPPPIVINEALPHPTPTDGNSSPALTDSAGDIESWFEIYNVDIDTDGDGVGDGDDLLLAGFAVTDTLTFQRWVAPDITLSAASYLVVFTDGELAEGELHAPWRPAENIVGGALDLGEVCGSTYQRFPLTGSTAGFSVALLTDGDASALTTDQTPTPGARNE